MNQSTAEFICNTLSQKYDIRVLPDYSGRGMYGSSTYAVTTPASMQELQASILEMIQLGEIYPSNVPSISGIRTDSLGKGYVHY